MPSYEVFIPAAAPALLIDVTLRVDAENWLAALKAGLERMSSGPVASNILCDVQADGSIHVTDPGGARVFRIREVLAVETPPGSIPLSRTGEGRGEGGHHAIPLVPRPPVADPEEALADLFLRVPDVHRRASRDDGLGFLLDLAMEKVRCESGSAFLSLPGARGLAFAVARGPKAPEVVRLGVTIPVGVGIVGFCAKENVGLAVSDAVRDPRFYRAVSEAVGYETRSLLCAPVAASGRVLGALELVNKAEGRPFDRADLAILGYLAHQAGDFLERRGA